MSIRTKTAVALAAACLGGFASVSHAALIVRDWKGARSGSFFDVKRWTPGSKMPGVHNVAEFDETGAYTVSFQRDVANSRLLIGHDKLVLNLKGHTYTLREGKGGSIVMGNARNAVARMTVLNGTLKSISATLGDVSGSSATATVTATGSWLNSGQLTIGHLGNGILNVTAGGELDSASGRIGAFANSHGTVLLNSPDSLWDVSGGVTVGNDKRGPGKLVVRDQAHADIGGNLNIRKTGQVSIADAGADAGTVTNGGKLQFTTGDTHLGGTLLNLPAGTVSVGADSVEFSGPVTHNGKSFSVSAGSVATFGDVVTGGGNFTGGGQLNFNGTYDPSTSGPISIHNDVVFGEDGLLKLDVGTSHDSLAVTGSADLAQIEFNVVNAAQIIGQKFTLLTATGGINTDAALFNINIDPNFSLQVENTGTALNAVVVPEPGLLLGGLLLVGGALLRRRKTR